MFNWLGNLFPYSDLHSLNLDWILNKMKETAAQAAKAIADSANALAQVIEAKTAAQNAQTAAQNAQTAAQNAQTAANNAADSAENAVNVAQAAKSAAQTAQNTANAAQSAAQTAQSAAQTAQSAAENAQSSAQTAQNTANTAQSTAETAQSTAQTAQSAAENAQGIADTANEGVNTLNRRFPIKTADIADSAVRTPKLGEKSVTLDKINTTDSYLYNNTIQDARFPRTGSATIDQITSGIEDTNLNRLGGLMTEFLHVSMDITEKNDSIPNTVFTCTSPVVAYSRINRNAIGICAIAPIIVIKNDTNDVYHGFIKLTQSYKTPSDTKNLKIKCEVIFNSAPPFNNDTKFVITANPVSAKLWEHV